MQSFPVSSSILSAPPIAAFVAQQYGLANVTCQLLKAGINHTYLVLSASGKYIFRIYSYQWRSDVEIMEEIKLLQHLRDNSMNVSVAIPDVQGSFIQNIPAPEGERKAVLFTFATGEKVHFFTAEQHYKAGVTMAEMHRHTEKMQLNRIQYTPEILITESLEKLRPYISFDTEEIGYMQTAKQKLLTILNTADTTAIRHGIVHMDMWFDNMNITDDGNITLFDFDFCGNSWLVADVAYYILQLYAVETDEQIFIEKKNSFLQGYESITRLTDEEKRLMPALGASSYFFYLGVQCERFENWANVFVSDTYLKRFITIRVKRWLDLCDRVKLC